MVITNKYKRVGDKDGFLTIDVKSGISADTQNNPVDLMGVKANIVLNGEISGTIKLNKKNPFLQSVKVTQDISGEMQFETGKETSRIIKLPMKITGTISSETTKK